MLWSCHFGMTMPAMFALGSFHVKLSQDGYFGVDEHFSSWLATSSIKRTLVGVFGS